ncbi:hypothetical protein P775_05265 [Puniceibacterium antarcticum]|uniref:SH3b domain-containing protein n=1 Tax=Puniceibacterium antarcticum TaxID=1206336 RepID=A0A2G8RHY1_9RHOB|nr:SH3 domain-containing protein [Puniceibacterium antarcticum]PIL21206.1 hypothetical protein P775_05265 [Puniceibacterium antarcticum]
MPRYVFVTFIVMVLAIYELSGGADFQPGTHTTADALSLGRHPAQTSVAAARSDARPDQQIAIARATVAPVREVAQASAPVRVGADKIAPVRVGADTSVVPGRVAADSAPALTSVRATGIAPVRAVRDNRTPGIVLTSLDGPTVARAATYPRKVEVGTAPRTPAKVTTSASPQAVAPQAVARQTAPDMRKVDGDRVNLRAGPGTGHAVLGSLVRGAPVEVLQDGGNGWVKLRAVDSGRVGWMAASLVTASAR